MIGQRDVLLHFLHLVGIHVLERIFLAVDGLGFQRGEHFGEGHGHGVGAQGLPGFQGDGVGHDAQLEAGNVFKLGDRALVVGHVAEAHGRPANAVHADLFHFLEHALGDGRVVQFVDFGVIGIREGNVPDLHFLDPGGEGSQRAHIKFLRAGLHALKHLFVAAKLGAVVHLNVDVAVGVLLRQFGELVHGHGLRVRIRHGVSEPDIRGGKSVAGQQGDRDDQSGDTRHTEHMKSSPDFRLLRPHRRPLSP